MSSGQIKRQCDMAPDVDDNLYHTRMIWNRDPGHPSRSTQLEEHIFRQFFGCGVLVCLNLSCALCQAEITPEAGTISHLLWTLMFCKIYGKENTMCSLAGGVDPGTHSKWAWLFIDAIILLESQVISAILHFIF